MTLRHINRASFLVVLSLVTSVSAQSRDGRAAFDRLLAAHDADIMDVIKNNRLVCFADRNPEWLESDRFLVIVTSEPQDSAWINTDSSKTIYGSEPATAMQYGTEEVYVWENEDNTLWVSSLLAGQWHGFGHYKLQGGRRWVAGDIGPVFRYSIDDDRAKALGSSESIVHDSTSFSATKRYDNKAKGTTEWRLSVRLSTGRYREEWDGMGESLGRCYRAKTLVKAAATPAAGGRQ